ncbi:hypothetical protein SLS56_007531 [Neofusicoccum ribis]|uniref:Spc7 kinetochore protein domain-containing protein n=1 Tax=Neofusicoccum ribis TaxID=45134 RepID=A0ABR3SMQ9_9PEZI
MSAVDNKENIAEGLSVGSPAKSTALSPKKSGGRKTRSKSIGPGGLDVPLKETGGNRRKSAMPAMPVKSILSREDEVKRREERRKSLARRRVSFAPEATLHTWDVIEYMRDATTSSASSNSTRRASNATQDSSSPERGVRFSGPDSDPAEPPSTPPEQAEDDLPSSSPEKQRDLHQKKRRRSSGIPPMNFNNPDDEFSSSPYSGSSATGSDDIEIASDDGDGSTMMSLDAGDDNEHTTASVASNDSTGSSARLDAALRQAAEQAGTTRFQIDDEDDEEASMEMASDEITAAFKPWVQRTTFSEDKENVQPAPLAFQLPGPDQDDTSEGEEMSMDITRAIGGIVVPRQNEEEQSPEPDNVTMDFTTAIGSIQSTEPAKEPNRAGVKRRRSSVLPATADDQGSPAKRQASRRMSIRKRKSLAQGELLEDGTMDLTTAIGGIKSQQPQEKDIRRESVDSSFGEQTMDFTMVMGGIENSNTKQPSADDTVISKDDNEDLSMEFTAILGSIQNKQQDATPATPELKKTAVATPPSKRGSAARFTNNHPEVPSPSPMKVNNAVIANMESPMPALKIHKDTTPKRSPRRSPRKSVGATKPDSAIVSKPATAVDSQPESLRKHIEPSPAKTEDAMQDVIEQQVSTPMEEASTTPVEEPAPKATNTLMDSIKLLSTPRKQVFLSPLKRPFASTPKQPTPRKSPSPKKTPSPKKAASPRKQVQFGIDQEAPAVEEGNGSAQETFGEDDEQAPQIQLQEFLELTKIRFMDLTTTKRRHTGYPGAQNGFGRSASMGAAEIEGKDDLETCVVAAACTEPEYLMYQHACHELKRYIAEGKNLVRQIEEETYEENPALFREYLSAPTDQRQVMDNQFKNMKTNARLKTKEAWYGWRSNLLHDIKAGLMRTADSFNDDDMALKKQEEIVDSTLPVLQQHHDKLETECQQLQRRAEELNGADRDELDAAREQLIAAETTIAEKRRKVEALQKELAEKEAGIEAVKERKVECIEEIKAAERVREECRGWSVDEVSTLKARVSALESEHGWLITSASMDPKTVTMSYRSDLQLFFHPSAFAPHALDEKSPNATISLTYIGDSKPTNATPLTTTKRFFLQVLRANLHCLPQATTSIRSMLMHVARGWDVALAVAENVRRLSLAQITDECILSDERMAVNTNMLLPSVQSKVRCVFEVGVTVNGVEDLKTDVTTSAKVIYGEQYKEGKMAEFLGQFVGTAVAVDKSTAWGDAVTDLRDRLVARGKKGGRID